MADRYSQDIRRIVNKDETRDKLPPPKSRDDIKGQRGIGYFIDDSPASSSGSPGETLAPDTAVPAESLLGEENPQTDSITSTDSDEPDKSTAEDLLDGLVALGEKLKEIEAKDCDSGLDMNIRTDGQYPPIDETRYESNSLDTLEWIDAEEPPEVVGWTSGKRWVNANGDFAISPGSAGQLHADEFNDTSHLGDSDWIVFDLIELTVDSYNYKLKSKEGTGGPFTFGAGAFACVLGVDAACPIIPPVEELWPITDANEGLYQVAFIDGQFQTTEFDPNRPATSIPPKGAIEFCTDDLSRTGKIEPTSNGGFMISELNISGDPISPYQVFDSNSVLVDIVSDEVAAFLRPSATTVVE